MYTSKNKIRKLIIDPRLKPLITAATEVFRNKGYDKATITDVADLMGIQKGSVYHYVKSKRELFYMVCIGSIRNLVETFREISERGIGTERKILLGLEHHIRMSCEEPALMILAAESDDNPETGQVPEMKKLRREYQELWKKVLIDGQAEGILSSHLDWNLALNGIFGMLQWMYKWYRPESPHSPEKIYETFATLIMQGIKDHSKDIGQSQNN